MAGDQSSNPPSSASGKKPAGRTSPVLVPQGSLEGQPEIPLNRPVTTVGSNENARLHLLSRTVSKGHAIFVNSGGATYVADLASRTGTLVNGKSVTDAELKNGDRVQIGKFVFRYRLPANLAAAVEPVEAPPAAVIVVGWPALPIPGRAVSIGRGERSDISLSDDPSVSAPHAAIFQVDGQWVIRDLGSRTGTVVNEKPIHQQVLNFGDRVTIGSSTILFQPGASIEDEFLATEAAPAEEEFSEPVPAEAIEELAPVTASAPAEDDDQIPLISEEISLVPVPVEAVAPEPIPVPDEAEIPLADEQPNDAIDWNATPATDLPAEDLTEIETTHADERGESVDQIAGVTEIDWNAISATVKTTEVEPVASELQPADLVATEIEETAAPDTDELPSDAIDWNEIAPAVDAMEAVTEAEPTPVVEATPEEDTSATIHPSEIAEVPIASDSTVNEAAWSATIAADLQAEPLTSDESALEQSVEPEPAAVEAETELEDARSEVEPPAVGLDETVNWNATVAAELPEGNAGEPEVSVVDSPIEQITDIEPAPAEVEFTPVIADEIAAEPTELHTQTVSAPAADPRTSTPPEEFVFAPVEVPVDTDEIPEVLFWGDPELDAATEQAVTHLPVALAESVIEVIEGTALPNAAEVLALPVVDAALTQFSAPHQILEEEEIALPADLAAFSKASEATAESYGGAGPASKSSNLPSPENTEPAVEDFPAFIDAVAEPEPIEPIDQDFLDTETTVTQSDESAIGWTALADQDEAPDEEHFTVSENSTAADTTPPVSDESDLDFIDFGEGEPPETEPPAAAPIAETPEPATDPAGPAHGPSIFGFQFEGGSFLGGMPISLHEPVAAAAAAAVSSTIFDAKKVNPSGLETMKPPVIETPPPPVTARSTRPLTPPRPALGVPATATRPTSLTGLVSEARTPWSGPPAIPPTVRGEAAKSPTRVRQRMTTAFSAPGAAPRNAEVFSQLAAPIGVEVFGGKPGNPDQFTVPDSKETAAELAGAAVTAVAEPPAAAQFATPTKRRQSRLPWLAALFFIIPAILWAIMYACAPISSRLISAKLMGSLTFDGLTNLSGIDGVNFRKEQERRLLFNSEDIRQRALTELENKNQPPGFIGNADDYAKTVDNQYLNWNGNTLQFTFNTNDATAGSAQVNAVLMALADKDRDLDSARIQARKAADDAQIAVDETAARVQKLSQERRTLLDQAQESPDVSTVADADQEAATLTKKWNDAKAVRQSSEAVLADLRSQDLSKRIDVESDPQIIDLKKRLDPLSEQIARLKGISALSAGAAATTTQPAADVDPLLAPLQQQADLLTKKLEQRRAELGSDASMSPAQREVNMAARIENLSVKITALQKAESDAKSAADAANAKSSDNHAKMSAARLAGVKAEELYAQQTEVETEHTRAVQAQSDAEAALANCVTVARGSSAPPTVMSVTDLRKPIVTGTSALSCFILGMMIAGELRRPKLMTAGVKPAAAPLVHPPAKVIPWPEPEELEGLESNDPPVVGEPDQVFGV